MPLIRIGEVPQQQPPPLTENLALMELQTAQLEAEASGIAGTGTYPDWWHREAVSTNLVRHQLKDPEANPDGISQYFQLRQRQEQARTTITGHEYDVSPIHFICSELGTSTVARGFRAEAIDGPMHTSLVRGLTSATEKKGYITPELELLRNVYALESTTDLLGVRDDAYSGALKPLLHNENTLKWMRFIDTGGSHSDTLEEYKSKTRKWMRDALSSSTGIGGGEADNYVFAAAVESKSTAENRNILDLIDRFEYFSVDRLRALSAFTGIHAFEDYSVAQLERMEDLLRNPQEAAERLAQQDVNVVMVNRVGDHNGIMHDAAANFEDDNARTLFFEINNLGDIYRHMLTLHKLGIRPSTLVLAAHSAPGQFIVSDLREQPHRHDIATVAGRNLVRQLTDGGDFEAGETGNSMHGMRGMARLVEDFMQPSRAIDDAPEDTGRKKILFQACDAASEVETRDMDEQDVQFVMGMDSIVSRLGNDLVANGVHTGVDIYGAPGGIQLHKSSRGVRYTSQPTSSREGRQPLQAVRVRLESGTITQQKVDEVVLHKAA